MVNKGNKGNKGARSVPGSEILHVVNERSDGRVTYPSLFSQNMVSCVGRGMSVLRGVWRIEIDRGDTICKTTGTTPCGGCGGH